MFCFKFEKFFMFEKEVYEEIKVKFKITHAHFNWYDDDYTRFMMNMMN